MKTHNSTAVRFVSLIFLHVVSKWSKGSTTLYESPENLNSIYTSLYTQKETAEKR